MSRATVLGDAVVASINGETFSIEFTSTRVYKATWDLKQLADLKVQVIVPTTTQVLTSRGCSTDNTVVDILFQKQADGSNLIIMDALADLVEEVAEHLWGEDFNNQNWVGTEIVTFYDMEDISDFRLFSSLLRLTYRYPWRKSV